MTLTEKVAYIKGLTEGLKLDEKKDEVKVINEIISLLENMASSVTDIEECLDDMSEQLDAVDEDLAELEDDFCEVLEDECGCGCDSKDAEDDWEDEFYEVTCPSCGEEICVEEDVLLCGEIECPKCAELLEFDFSSLMDEDDCGCGCDSCVTEEKEDVKN